MSTIRNACMMHVIGCGFLLGSACSGDDVSYGPETGLPKSDATIDQSTSSDAGVEATVPPRLLMTYLATSGELAAFNLTTNQVDERLSLSGYAVTEVSGSDLYL